MRANSIVALLCLVPFALPAQAFEGKVSVRLSAGTAGVPQQVDMTMYLKGQHSAMIMKLPNDPSAGPMAGAEMRMLGDYAAGTMTTLMPMPAQMANAMPGAANAKGLKFTISLDQVNRMNPGQRGQGQPEKVNIKALGTTEKIAGYACDDYEITNARGEAWRMCASSTLGTFVFPGMSGPMGRGSSGAPDWARALGNKPMFPLKVWTPGDNKVSFEVTAIERIAVPDSTFVVPDGYMDMSAFGRGRGGD